MYTTQQFRNIFSELLLVNRHERQLIGSVENDFGSKYF